MSAERGQKIMTSQSYEIRNAIVEGDSVALKVYWTGSLAVPFESIPAGGQMRAYFAMFLTFREARLFRSEIMIASSPSSFGDRSDQQHAPANWSSASSENPWRKLTPFANGDKDLSLGRLATII